VEKIPEQRAEIKEPVIVVNKSEPLISEDSELYASWNKTDSNK
jgi:hypothetical protein